ncbi:pentatricopeptide repeat-containing protein At2g20710, mitochondrial [Morus notabilis]|uniref:pentatricopeptide repeat-containing protein At2g20710, mitochondrial n=1 Tax=Morus notabilis TaxID=981085 RepID=UPI000CECEDCA|nr:pentatricopeptide repeat-containing protein At2g20710, mitochondrial [Morus notabilis]
MKPFGANQWRRFGISRVFSSLFYSTTRAPKGDTLFQRISRCGDPKISLIPVLNHWAEQGRDVNQPELQRIIKQLRKYRRFSHALQISEWMSEGMNCDLSPGDVAVKLDLVSKVHGLDQAEEYFNSIPPALRADKIYGALLNCYAEKKYLEKAERLFQKMRKLGFIKSNLSYNVMLSLYSRMGKHEKLKGLLQEMEENGIKHDKYTFSIRLNAYAVTSDIEGMEKLLMEMEADPQVNLDFHAYFVAAKGYLKAGLYEKAIIMLRRSEQQIINSRGKRIHYEHLLTLYAAAGQKNEVYRIWNLYKNMEKLYNSGYLSVLSALVKLEDIDGAEKIYAEWESWNTCFDNRIANLLISAYCKNGLLEKALLCVERLINNGHEPAASIWQCLANQCCIDGRMAKAVETMKKAVLANEPKLKLNRSTLAVCLEYLKREGDVETAHEILGLLREQNSLSNDICDRLVNFINSNEDIGALGAMEEDDQIQKVEEDHDMDGKMNV